jgi:hypothetical protein
MRDAVSRAWRFLGVERGPGAPEDADIHVLLRPEKLPLRVELGPGWYWGENGLGFATDAAGQAAGQRLFSSAPPNFATCCVTATLAGPR